MIQIWVWCIIQTDNKLNCSSRDRVIFPSTVTVELHLPVQAVTQWNDPRSFMKYYLTFMVLKVTATSQVNRSYRSFSKKSCRISHQESRLTTATWAKWIWFSCIDRSKCRLALRRNIMSHWMILDSLLLAKTNLMWHTYRTSWMPFSSTVHMKLRQKLRKTFENKCAFSVYQVSTFVIGSFFILGVCDWFKQNATFFKNSVSQLRTKNFVFGSI